MLERKLYIVLIVSLIGTLFTSCEERVDHYGRTPILGVDKVYLYKEDLSQLYAIGNTIDDSIAFVNEYVCHWLEDALLYRMARRNVPDSKEVERLVENYRKSLLLNIYQDNLIHQQLRSEIAEDEISGFYESNSELFLLDEPMLQGLFLKVSKTAPSLASVRKWLKGGTSEDMENLEKYTITNAIVYDYFIDTWRTLDALAAKMPIASDDLLSRLKKNNFVEISDTAAFYFVSSTALLDKGGKMPLDIAKDKICELLVNSKKADFIKKAKYDLLMQAVEAEEIEFFDNETAAALKKYAGAADK